jgi:hypothetical protein
MDSSSITNTNKRRQQQQQQKQQSNNKRGTNPPLHKQIDTTKKILFLCKNCKFCTNTKFSHQF